VPADEDSAEAGAAQGEQQQKPEEVGEGDNKE